MFLAAAFSREWFEMTLRSVLRSRASTSVLFASRRSSRARSFLFTIIAFSLLAQACRPKRPEGSGDGDGDHVGDGDQGQVDLCGTVDCGLHGSCAVSSNNAFCFCHPGYFTLPTGGSCLKELSSERPEPEGEHCLFGGTATESGLDLNDDGVLASIEVTSTSYACAAPGELCPATLCGEHGACVLDNNAPGCVCNSGYAGARCDACASGFVARPSDGLCSTPRQITDLRDEEATPSCPNGSYAVITGTDADFNGVLDLDEVAETNSLCKVVIAGNVVVTNQAELEALAGVTDIAGNLVITTSYVENLLPLSSLIHVQGQLLIKENQALKGLDSLGRLNSVGSLEIAGNTALANIAGLDALQRSGSIKVYRNPVLTSVDLGAIGVIEGDLWLQDNPVLVSLHSGALRSIVKALVVAFHPVLLDLSGLSALVSVGSEIWLEDNDALATVEGFTKLVDAGGLLVIGCDGLLNFDGLAALKSLRGGLTVDDNDVLTAMDGLNSLEIIEGGMVIVRNAQLLSLAGLQSLGTLGGGVSVRENPKLGSVTGLTMVSSLKQSSSLPLSEITAPVNKPGPCDPFPTCVQAQLPPILLAGYRGTRELPLYAVEFSQNPLLESVAGFVEVNQITSAQISENPELASMPFLSTLERVTSLQISGSGFTALQLDQLKFRAEGDDSGQVVQIEDNLGLLDLRLSKLDALSKLVVEGNPKLTALRFSAITCSENAVLRVVDNVALTTFSGLAAMDDCYSLSISGNASLVTLEDFSALVAMSFFTLQNNAILNHAPNFPALTGNTLNVTVADNPKLENVPASAVPLAYLTLLNLPKVASLAGTNLGAGTKDVRIENLDKLANLSGLSALADQAIGNFRLIDNDGLASTAGMGKLADLNGLSIIGNDALTDLVGFSELTQIGPLEIKGNLLLASLADLTKLTKVTGSLTITGNPELPNCQAVALKNEVYPSGNVANNDMAASCN